MVKTGSALDLKGLLVIKPTEKQAITSLAKKKCAEEIKKGWQEESYWFCWKSSVMLALWCQILAVVLLGCARHDLSPFVLSVMPLLFLGKFENTSSYSCCHQPPLVVCGSCGTAQEPAFKFIHYHLFKWDIFRRMVHELREGSLMHLDEQVVMLKEALKSRYELLESNNQKLLACYEKEANVLEEHKKKYLYSLSDDSETRKALEHASDKIIQQDFKDRDELLDRQARLKLRKQELTVRLDSLLANIISTRTFVPLVDNTVTDDRWFKIETELDEIVTEMNKTLAEAAIPAPALPTFEEQARLC